MLLNRKVNASAAFRDKQTFRYFLNVHIRLDIVKKIVQYEP